MNSPAIESEAQLRSPAERVVFVASAALNLLLITSAVLVIIYSPEWLKAHPVIAKRIENLRAIAIAAVFAPPALTFLRNTRLASVRGNSLRLSPKQSAGIYEILAEHCRRLGMREFPELYLSDRSPEKLAGAYSAWNRHYIVLGTSFVETDIDKVRDVVAFMLGRELGRIRLGHITWWDELLLGYVVRRPVLNRPLYRARTFAHDRYGAFLAPYGMRGLVIFASAPRLLPAVNVAEYLKAAKGFTGTWAYLTLLTSREPHVADRLNRLCRAGLFSPYGGSGRTMP